jgi:hypothetical protein
MRLAAFAQAGSYPLTRSRRPTLFAGDNQAHRAVEDEIVPFRLSSTSDAAEQEAVGFG